MRSPGRASDGDTPVMRTLAEHRRDRRDMDRPRGLARIVKSVPCVDPSQLIRPGRRGRREGDRRQPDGVGDGRLRGAFEAEEDLLLLCLNAEIDPTTMKLLNATRVRASWFIGREANVMKPVKA